MTMPRSRFATAIPISNDGVTVEVVRIDLPHPITLAEWEQFEYVLNTMRPALVAESADSEVTP